VTASVIIERFSRLGDAPAWMWMLAMMIVSAGCDATDTGDAPIAASLVSAIGAFAYAHRVRVTSDARTQNAVLAAMENYRADAETASAAAISERRHRAVSDDTARQERRQRDECEARCDALHADVAALRELLHGAGYRVPELRSK